MHQLVPRLALISAVTVVVVLGLPACNPLDPCGGAPLTTTPAAAVDRATSCVETVSYEGRDYTPWCAAVQPALIAENPQLSGNQGGSYYEGRFIQGVSPEQAMAIASLVPDTSGVRHRQRHCGGIWRIAFDTKITQADAEAIAKQVAIPGSLNLN